MPSGYSHPGAPPRKARCGRIWVGKVMPFLLGFSMSLFLSSVVYMHTSCNVLEERAAFITVSIAENISRDVHDVKESCVIGTQDDEMRFFMPTATWEHSDEFVNRDGLIHIYTVLDRLGRDIKGDLSQWDLIYTFLTIVKMNRHKLPNELLPHQKITFVPGGTAITEKDYLMTKDLPHMAKSFNMQFQRKQFQEYSEKKPNATWLVKKRQHRGRGVTWAKPKDILNPPRDSILQEFISEPFVIDNRKLEVAVYTTIMSVNPMRAYINQGDWYLRFCAEEYYPFDLNNREKYVSSSLTHRWPWQIPSLKQAHDRQNMTIKQGLFSYLRMRGFNPDRMETTMKEIIRNVYTNLERDIIHQWKTKWNSYGKLHQNFFEVHRFDFLLDKDLNVYLIEVNLNPDVSSNMAPVRRQQNERLIYGILSLAGMGSNPRRPLLRSSLEEREMLVHGKDLSVYNDFLWSGVCLKNCSASTMCRYSVPCMSAEDIDILQRAALEHFHRYDWVRVVPEPFQSREAAKRWKPVQDPHFTSLTPRSKWMAGWFWGKCLENEIWCH